MSKQYAKRPPARRKRSSTPLAAWLLVGGGLVLLAVVAVLAWPRAVPKAQMEVTGAPKLKVDQDKVDLGNVTLGQTVEVTFQLTNVGDQPLRIAHAPFVEVVEGC